MSSGRLRVRVLVLVTALLAASAFAPRLIALVPLKQDVSEAASRGDDWLTYQQFALSVMSDGWTMPAVPHSYSRPGGFGYVYFVALVYSILGVRSGAVYLVQGLLLIAALATLVLTFAPRLSTTGGLLLALSLVFFAGMDMFGFTVFHLLSENLLVPLVALLLWLVVTGTTTARARWFVAAGVTAGACALTRPNVVFFGPAIAILLAFCRWHPQPAHRRRMAMVFLAGCAAAASFLPVRNLAVSGELGAMAALHPEGWERPAMPGDADGRDATPARRTWGAAVFYARRIAYVLGATKLLDRNHRLRPHWLLMWGGIALYLLGRWRREFWEVLLLTMLASYLLPLVAVASIDNYDPRMVAPMSLFALPLVMKAADAAIARFRAELGA